MANTQPTTSGRRLLGAGAAILTVASIALAPAKRAAAFAVQAASPDAELLAVCAEFQTANVECMTGSLDKDVSEGAFDASTQRRHAALGRLIRLRARTPAGKMAKARAGYDAMLLAADGSWGREEYAAFAALGDILGEASPTDDWDDEFEWRDASHYSDLLNLLRQFAVLPSRREQRRFTTAAIMIQGGATLDQARRAMTRSTNETAMLEWERRPAPRHAPETPDDERLQGHCHINWIWWAGAARGRIMG
jgi:hypothetical protein